MSSIKKQRAYAFLKTHTLFRCKIIKRGLCLKIDIHGSSFGGYDMPAFGTVKYFSQKHLCQNEVQRRKVRRGGLPSPAYLPCSVFRRRCQGCRFSGIHRSDRLRSRRPLTTAAGYAKTPPCHWNCAMMSPKTKRRMRAFHSSRRLDAKKFLIRLFVIQFFLVCWVKNPMTCVRAPPKS